MKRSSAAPLTRARSDSGEDLIDIDQGKVLMTCDPTTLGTKELVLAPPQALRLSSRLWPGYGSRGSAAGLLRSLCRTRARAHERAHRGTLRGRLPYRGRGGSRVACFQGEEQEHRLQEEKIRTA